MTKLSLKILMCFVVYRNTKKLLNIVTFHDKNNDCAENSIRFPCQSNNNNFNMFIPKKPVNHGIAFNKQWNQILSLWFRKHKSMFTICLYAFSCFVFELSKRTVFKNRKFIYVALCFFIVLHINLPKSIALAANEKGAGCTNLLKSPVARKLLQKWIEGSLWSIHPPSCFTKGC